MGLIKAFTGSVFSSIGDMWEDYIYCSSLDNDTLVQKGVKRKSGGAGNAANENVISKGSRIAVNDGQMLIVVENGQIIDFTAEQGGYEYSSETEPSLFCGSFGEGLRNTFEVMKGRFAFGGTPTNDQRVYFINTKEILNNLFGFGNVAYRDSEFDITIYMQGFGNYTFRIADPIHFYKNISGNIEGSYKKSTLDKQMKADMQKAMLVALGELSAKNVKFDQITQNMDTFSESMQEYLKSIWLESRGLELVTVNLTQINPDEASLDKIRDMQESRAYSKDKAMMGARIGAAQANAMEAAAENPAGAVSGFMGMNMAQSAGAANVAELMKDAPSSGAPKAEEPVQKKMGETWVCSCGRENRTLFCPKCGGKKPELRVCGNCKETIDSEFDGLDFCPYCGNKL